MGFLSFLLFVVTVYVRPGEVIDAWRGAPVAQIVLPICSLLTISSLLIQQNFKWVAADTYAAAFLAVALISIVVNGWAGGMVNVLLTLGPSVMGYYFTRVAFRTVADARRLAVVVVLLSAFLAGNGLLQYYAGVGLGDVHALIQTDGTDDPNADLAPNTEEVRIRGTGIFNDPNDLAFALVIAAPLNLWLFVSTRGLFRRTFLFTSFASLITATVLTHSRGGFVGLGVALGIMLKRKYGWVAASAAALVVLVGFMAFASGRTANFSGSESSAQGRIEAWAAGMHMLRTHPIFGVGYGAFTDYHQLVAHNSYVHVFAELGLAGGYLFVGLLCFFVSSWRVMKSPLADDGYLAWMSAGVGGLLCCWFLSRQYSPSVFMLFAVGGSILEQKQSTTTAGFYVLSAVAAAGAIVAVYISISLLKAW